MVIGPIAVTYNLDGIDKLVLDAATLAAIFQGEITTWNDPKIAALNDGVTLPSTPIKPFFRSTSRHHGELHQVPQGRGRRRLGR